MDEINRVEHAYALWVLARPGAVPAQYLLQYEPRWKGWLFPYIKLGGEDVTTNTYEEGLPFMLEVLLGIQANDISCHYIAERNLEKYSIPHAEMREYIHRLFRIEIRNGSDLLLQDEFELNHRSYKWMSFEEMKADEAIWAMNGDVISWAEEQLCQSTREEN